MMPYCPTCRTEYGSQSELCEICSSKLVDVLPPINIQTEDEGTELMELAEFSNVSEAEMIREILEKNGILTVLRGEIDPIGIASGAAAITLLVEQRCMAQARELYETYFAGSDTEETQSGEESEA
jgi:hypothetical protein